ncbi:Uncharacterised protein [Pseudomonas aeruginosa]|nr:Uncharacterised protein [Pseudomonas aeruginosa]
MFDNDRLLLRVLLFGLLGASLWVLAPFWSALFWPRCWLSPVGR